MGVLQDVRVRVRSLLYDRAERFIAAEDGRRTDGLRERFQERFVAFYDERQLGERGYEGYKDLDARFLFDFYDRFGEKGLELVGFYDGVKLSYGDILSVRHFVEHCELIENTDKGLNRGINLASKLVEEFSLKTIVDKFNGFKDPELIYTLNLRYKLAEREREQSWQTSGDERENDFSDIEPQNNEVFDGGSLEVQEQISDVDKLIAGATVRSKATETGIGMIFDRELS